MNQTEAIKTLQDSLYRALPLYEHIEASVEEIGQKVRCSVPLNAKNRNHFGAVHAALQFAVCEMTGALAVSQHPVIRSGDYRLVVKSLEIEFLKPAMSDVEASTTITRSQQEHLRNSLSETGKAQLKLDIELADADGKVVAKAAGQYHVSRNRKTD